MRELTDRERDVLTIMVESAEPFAGDPAPTFEERARWRSQLAGAHAGTPCGCGTCPSIELTDENGITPSGGNRVVLEGATPGASLLLFIDGDRLSYLELAPHGDDVFTEFPLVSTVSV